MPEERPADTLSKIDCDLHVPVPGLAALLPYMDAYWREQITVRGIEALDLSTYPAGSPLTMRPDWRPAPLDPRTALDRLRADALDAFGSRLAICNVVYGGQALFNVYFGAAVCRAINDWIAREWLDAEPRLRASIVVPMQDPELAVAEIERCASDLRFVQVLLLASGDAPLGRRQYWPIYRAAERYGLPIGIHAGSGSRFAPSYVGWPTYLIEDYALQSQTFQGQMLSLVYEGVFNECPKLKVVFVESGVTWLPTFLWRAVSTWRALRVEVPWIDRAPDEIVREHFRFTLQPFDAPKDAGQIEAVLDHLGSDDLILFSTDYPHGQFDGDAVIPDGFPADVLRKMTHDNPVATYPRLAEALS